MASGKKAKKQRQRQRKQTKPPAGGPPSAVSPTRRQKPLQNTLLALALITVIGLLVYSNTFQAPFEFDDMINITDNPFIRVTHISPEEIIPILKSRAFRRPLANLTFALNYYFHQYDVIGYHIVNVIIHLISAFLVFLLTRQTLGLCRIKSTWIALPTALLWLVNPLHTQSVTYIVQRMNAMAAMFYLLTMVCYIQGRLLQRKNGGSGFIAFIYFMAAALSGLFGMASKEISATLPAMIFLYEWYFLQHLERGWIKKQMPWIIASLTLITAISLIYLNGAPIETIASLYARKNFSFTQRLMSEPGVVLYYLSLMFYPAPDRLQLIYDFPLAVSPFTVYVLLSFTALAGLITAALFLREKNRLLSFALVWFLGNLVIESSVIPQALAYEHRTYLPSVFIFISLVALLFRKTTPEKALIVVVAGILISGVWSWQRNALWADEFAFWSDAVKKTPADPRTHCSLGMAYKEEGNLEAAITHFKAAVGQDATYEKAYNNIGNALINLKRPAEAIPFLEKSTALNPDYEDAYYNLGQAYNNLGKAEKAESYYEKVLAINPLSEKAHNNMGLILLDQGRSDEAIAHFKRALDINPYYEKPYNNMAIACFQKGETGLSVTYFKKALALRPDYTEAARNLEFAVRTLEKYGPTIKQLQQARRQRPDDMDTARQLAETYRQAGITDSAVDLYEQLLSHDPGCGKCLDSLSRIYEASGRYNRAAQMLERKAALYPHNPGMLYHLAGVYARGHQKEKAVENLKKAVTAGFTDIDHIRNDKNLTAIRDTDYFQALTAAGK